LSYNPFSVLKLLKKNLAKGLKINIQIPTQFRLWMGSNDKGCLM